VCPAARTQSARPAPQVLFWKKRGEEAVQRSGIPYTIVRTAAAHAC